MILTRFYISLIYSYAFVGACLLDKVDWSGAQHSAAAGAAVAAPTCSSLLAAWSRSLCCLYGCSASRGKHNGEQESRGSSARGRKHERPAAQGNAAVSAECWQTGRQDEERKRETAPQCTEKPVGRVASTTASALRFWFEISRQSA